MSGIQQQRAVTRARRLYPASEGFQGAYVRGARAALSGGSPDACPYKNRRGWTAWRNAWLRGFKSVAPTD